MNPQTTIDQIPDEKLATLGWNLREQQDGHRKQVEVIEDQLRSIRSEFQRRNQLTQATIQSEEDKKRVDEDALVTRIVKALSAGKAGEKSVPETSKDEVS